MKQRAAIVQSAKYPNLLTTADLEYLIQSRRDIAVVAFDRLTISQHFAAPLTTMRQPRDEIGRRQRKR